jgi:hypothetical protein
MERRLGADSGLSRGEPCRRFPPNSNIPNWTFTRRRGRKNDPAFADSTTIDASGSVETVAQTFRYGSLSPKEKTIAAA